MPDEILQLDLETLADRCPHLTRARVESYVESAEVALHRHHRPPRTTTRVVTGTGSRAAEIRWAGPGPIQQATYGDRDEATEDGACALAIALAVADGMRVVSRLPKGTGADFFVLMPAGMDDEEEHVRMEVSGIGAGIDSAAHGKRIRQKEAQLRTGVGPGHAVVVAFEPPTLYREHVE